MRTCDDKSGKLTKLLLERDLVRRSVDTIIGVIIVVVNGLQYPKISKWS